MDSSRQLAFQSILRSRIQGEKIIAIIRFILLIPLTGFALFIFIREVLATGFLKTLAQIPFIVNFVSISLVTIYSVWLLKQLKKEKYHNSIQFISPAIDITLLNFIVYFNAFNAATPREGLIFTGSPNFLYFIFLTLAVLRYSPASVIFTGVYISVSYSFFSGRALLSLSILTGNGNTFVNEFQKMVRVDWDDEIFKPIIFIITTGLCAYIAKRIKDTIMNQISTSLERESLRETFVTHVKEVSGKLISSGKELMAAYSEFLARIEGMVKSSRNIEQETNVENDVVASTSGTISVIIQSINTVSNNIQSQAGLINETVAAIEEMSGSIRMIANTSQKASNVASELLGAARDGSSTVSDVNQAIIETENESKKIEEIVEIISGIAGTTNLLSMNASIEAAHAGDAGKGFAVIAEEIGKLAETSASNANQISEILKGISARINNIVELAENANGKLQTIVDNSYQTTEVNAAIRNAMDQELATINDMIKSLHSLNAISEDVKRASMQQSDGGRGLEGSITQLKKQADNVMSLVNSQMTDFNEISELSKILYTAVEGNERIVAQLDDLLKKI